jgi:hypothetical protein
MDHPLDADTALQATDDRRDTATISSRSPERPEATRQ